MTLYAQGLELIKKLKNEINNIRAEKQALLEIIARQELEILRLKESIHEKIEKGYKRS